MDDSFFVFKSCDKILEKIVPNLFDGNVFYSEDFQYTFLISSLFTNRDNYLINRDDSRISICKYRLKYACDVLELVKLQESGEVDIDNFDYKKLNDIIVNVGAGDLYNKAFVNVFDYSGIVYDSTCKKFFIGSICEDDFGKLYCGLIDDDVIYSNNFSLLNKLCSSVFCIDKNTYIYDDVCYKVFDSFNFSKFEVEDLGSIKNKLMTNKVNKKFRDVDRKINKSFLQYGSYLTDVSYEMNPAIGRDREIYLLEKSLVVPRKGVLLVGASGVGKTSIVEGLAYQIQNGNVCDMLLDKEIFSVTTSSLLAGCIYRGQYEERIENLCNFLVKNKNVILFLDELHTAIGDKSSNGVTLANILKPYISSDDIKVIGCTTDREFDRFLSDGAFTRRFNILEIQEVDRNVLEDILRNYIMNNPFGIDIKMSNKELEGLINIIIQLSTRRVKYINQSLKNPDGSINIVMKAFSYLVINNINVAGIDDFILGIKDIDGLLFKEFDDDIFNLKIEDDDLEKNKIVMKVNKKHL